LSNAQLLEQLGEVDAGGAARRRVGIGDGPRGEQALLPGIDGGDIGEGCSLLDGDADTDAGQRLGAAFDDLVAEQGRQRRRRQHDDVEIFARCDALGQAARRVVVDRDRVAGPLLEFRHDLQRYRLESPGGQQLQVGSRRRTGSGQDAEDDQKSTHGFS
jgi:hypothetical protein